MPRNTQHPRHRHELRWVLLIACCFSLSIGCQPSAQDAEVDLAHPEPTKFTPSPENVTLHDRGVALMGQFDYAGAHEVFAALVQEFPEWHDAQVDLAISKLNRRQGQDAEDAGNLLDNVIVASPDNLRAKYCRAILRLYNGNTEEALSLFQTVAESDETDAYAAYYTGQCLFDLGKYDEAVPWFERAQAKDAYLRSSYYGLFQAFQRLGKLAEAKEQLELFQKLAKNPQARSAEIKYSRMGPKAEATTVPLMGKSNARPAGALFQEPVALKVELPSGYSWAGRSQTKLPNCTVCDINGDGLEDLFVANGLVQGELQRHAVFIRESESWKLDVDHPLSKVDAVNAVLWGDIDNDSLVDVYFCCDGANQLWRQVAKAKWEDISESSQTGGPNGATVDGAMFDADHDGDLDLFLVQSNGPNELLNNNLDGTFRTIAEQQGLASDRASAAVVVADWDNDRDADLLVLNREAPHELYLNDRLWNYTPLDDSSPGVTQLLRANITSITATDSNADGRIEIVTGNQDGLFLWQRDGQGTWESSRISAGAFDGRIAVQDFDGDGKLEVLGTTANRWVVVDFDGNNLFEADAPNGLGAPTLAALSATNGWSVVQPTQESAPLIYAPGPGRFAFAEVSFSGKDRIEEQMRSNASGIGVTAAARTGGIWTALQSFRDQSGPGQSRQPLPVGVGENRSIEFVKVLWPDGIFQTELALQSGQRHVITETQRQVSSCPVLFVWDGEQFAFVSDVLGVGGLGFNHGFAEYSAPRPWENFLLPEDLVAAKRDRFVMKIGEPMEETCYLDAARLVAYDLPADWKMVTDDRQAVSDPQPSGEPIFYRTMRVPKRYYDTTGNDAGRWMADADGIPLPTGKPDARFLGRTASFVLGMQFDEPLDSEQQLVLVMDGWIEYPYSQTMFAAWQAGASYDAPTLEGRAADGDWQVIYAEFGYPAGMPKRMALPIDQDRLPKDCTELRITTNMEIYWDHAFVAVAEECPEVRRNDCRLAAARLHAPGFPRRSDTPEHRPKYDYSQRVPLWDTRHHPGFYSNFGDVLDLLSDVDDAVATIGPGEEIELEFDAAVPALAPNATRRFVLECNGWCKDMDLYTQNGETLSPLPMRELQTPPPQESQQRRERLHEKHHQRFRAGSP